MELEEVDCVAPIVAEPYRVPGTRDWVWSGGRYGRRRVTETDTAVVRFRALHLVPGVAVAELCDAIVLVGVDASPKMKIAEFELRLRDVEAAVRHQTGREER